MNIFHNCNITENWRKAARLGLKCDNSGIEEELMAIKGETPLQAKREIKLRQVLCDPIK